MDITHGGSFVPDPTPTGGPEVSQLNLADGTGVSWAVTRQAGVVVATPSVVNSALPGSEIGYDQITASVNITGTTSGAATTVLTASAHTFDGNPVLAEFFSPFVRPPGVGGAFLVIGLYEGGSLLAQIAQLNNPAAALCDAPVLASLRFAPSGGPHTYTIKAWISSTTGTPFIGAGTGTAGGLSPAYLRFTKV